MEKISFDKKSRFLVRKIIVGVKFSFGGKVGLYGMLIYHHMSTNLSIKYVHFIKRY